MDLTLNDVKDWKANPVTKAVLKEVAKVRDDIRENCQVEQGAHGAILMQETAMRCAYNEGVISGVSSFEEFIEDLFDRLGGENNE